MSGEVNSLSAKEIIQKDLESIYIGNLSTVDDNLGLPLEGKYGSRFVWESGEERFITREGIVHRPLHGMGNRKVTLTVRACLGEEYGEKQYAVTVLQEEKKTVVMGIDPVSVECAVSEKPVLPSVVIANTEDGRCLTMPVSWETCEPLDGEGKIQIKGKVLETEKEAVAVVHFVNDVKEKPAPKRKAEYYLINEVRLSPGTLYYDYQKRMLEYLLSVDDDQMLYNFRKASGLDTLGAASMTGWDAEECKLKGHTTGHYMSGLALAWGATGDERILQKIKYMVNGMDECQRAFAASGKYHRGFLSAYSEEQFDLLETFTKYPEIWAPYYTLDKIMSGLYDCYQIAGNEKAKEILELMGCWVYDRLSRLPKETLDKMWSMYIAGEQGGMFGTMVKLYQISGKPEYMKAAQLFQNEKLFYPMEVNRDTLEDMHANQHIPQILGAMDMFRATGKAKWWEIGKHFWEIITRGHIYCIGGVGETEMLHRAGTTCSYLTEKAAESCASYNMLRLTGQLFSYTLDGNMMDYYDNTLRNHILTSCSHTSDGGTTYFMPLGAGEGKEYSTTEHTCCHGTGMESRFRYMEHIYAYDENSVYVNLLIDSALNGDAKLEIRWDEPEGTVKIRCLEDMDKKLKIQIPVWTRKSYEVYVNDVKKEDVSLKNGYISISEYLCSGDEIRLKFKMSLRLLENESNKEFVNIAYGPYILAALSDKKDFFELPALEKFNMLDRAGKFEAEGIVYIPFAQVDLEAYHVYFKK